MTGNFGRMRTAPKGASTPLRSLTHSLDLRKEGLAMKATRTSCLNCGADLPLVQPDSGKKPRKHCSSACRVAYATPNGTCSVEDCDTEHYAKGYCRKHYVRVQRHGSTNLPEKAPPKPPPPCSVETCDRPAKTRALCVTHYSRLMHLGDVRAGVPIRSSLIEGHTDKNGYRTLSRPGHPLAWKSGHVLEHRLVAYEKYGPGRQSCHWCGVPLEWREVDVDHLDAVRDNNAPDNLVISCRNCNSMRASDGNPIPWSPYAPRGSICSVETCEARVIARDLCPTHYAAWRRAAISAGNRLYGYEGVTL